MQCIFCDIVAKNIPNYTVYEDHNALAFLDITPHAKGHTLVVPKVHAETIFELNEELTKHLFAGVKRTVERVSQVLSPDGFNIGWNHGTAGGQAVVHLHVHVIPRWNGDGGSNIHGIINNPGDTSVEELAALFKTHA